MIRKIRTQVIVIGAGPAGAAASIFLSKAEIPHVILEKEKFPRDKVCGDACGGKTAFVLRKADPLLDAGNISTRTQYMPTHGALFFSPDGRSLSIPFSRQNVLPGQAAGFTRQDLLSTISFSKSLLLHILLFIKMYSCKPLRHLRRFGKSKLC